MRKRRPDRIKAARQAIDRLATHTPETRALRLLRLAMSAIEGDADAKTRIAAMDDREEKTAPPRGDDLAGLALAMRRGTSHAAELLKTSFDSIVEAGNHTALWELLRSSRAAPLSAFRLRAALVVGTTEALDEVLARPRAETPETQLLLGRAQWMAGKLTEARATLESVAKTGAAIGARACIRLAQIELLLGDLPAAEAWLSKAQPEGIDTLDALGVRARVLIAKSHFREALALADSLDGNDDLPLAIRTEIAAARASVYGLTGRLCRFRALWESRSGFGLHGP